MKTTVDLPSNLLREAKAMAASKDCRQARQYRLPLLSRDKHFDAVSKLERMAW